MKGYDLSRAWFNFCFENPELIKPIHTAIFFFACEHYNRLGKKEKFGFPSQMTMEAIGVRKYQTYGRALSDLVDWGFIKMIERSKNQYSANIVSLCATPKNGTARGKALDKALVKHGSKQGHSTGQGKDSIDKPINQQTNKPLNQELAFDRFWNMYGLKKSKAKSIDKWDSLDDDTKRKIFETLPSYLQDTPDIKYRKQPITYLNQKVWMDYEGGVSGYDGVVIDMFEARKRASVRYTNPSDELVDSYMSDQGYKKRGEVWIVG